VGPTPGRLPSDRDNDEAEEWECEAEKLECEGSEGKQSRNRRGPVRSFVWSFFLCASCAVWRSMVRVTGCKKTKTKTQNCTMVLIIILHRKA
jgi:hypothetical protein